MTAHGEFPQGCGIRVGDNVHYMGPTGEEGRVTRVDYSAHLAYVEFTNSSGWEQFRHLWAQAVLDSEPNHVPVTA